MTFQQNNQSPLRIFGNSPRFAWQPLHFDRGFLLLPAIVGGLRRLKACVVWPARHGCKAKQAYGILRAIAELAASKSRLEQRIEWQHMSFDVSGLGKEWDELQGHIKG